jgi:hypothetical protein
MVAARRDGVSIEHGGVTTAPMDRRGLARGELSPSLPAWTTTACLLAELSLPRTSYVLRRLRLPAFSDSLQACGPSSSRCSTRSDCLSSRAPRCTWNSSRFDTNWPSSIDRGAGVFASSRPIESCGRGSHTPEAAGARRFTSPNRRRSSRGIAAGFASSGPGKADTAPAAQRCHLTCAR